MDGRKVSVRELVAAGLILAFGVFMAWEGSSYNLGTVRQMGPGYFPVALGTILALLGAALVVEAWRSRPQEEEKIALRPLLSVIGAVLVFGFVAPRLGFIPGTFCLVLLSVLGEKGFRRTQVIGLVIGLPLLGYLIFVLGLGMQLEAFKW